MPKPIEPAGSRKHTPTRKPTKEETTINLSPRDNVENIEEETAEPVSCAAQGIPDSPMLNAFLNQSGIDYNDDEQRFDGSDAEERKKLKSADTEAQEAIMEYMGTRAPKTSSISDTVEYPSQLSEGDLNETMDSQGHSVDKVRDWENLPKDEDPPKGFQLGFRG